MEPAEIQKECLLILKSAKKLILNLEKERTSKVIVLFCFNYPIITKVAYVFNKILRKIKEAERLDLFLESSGGDIDTASKISKLCKSHTKEFNVIVADYAKSAASLIALSADNLIMTKSGELGPIDPIVKHPATKMWIPAHSIGDALKFIEETKDPFVKLTMADKLDPLLIGAFKDAENASHQYVEEIFEKHPKKDNLKELFTTKYKSHGYPITQELCNANGIKNAVSPNDKIDSLVSDLHETYVDGLLNLQDEESEGALIVQSVADFYFEIDGIIITPKVVERQKEERRKK